MNMGDEGEVVSLDLHQHRVELIKKGAERLKLKSVRAEVADATVFAKELGTFDKVLCDVPCSGIGVIRRKPEIKYKKEAECNELLQIQAKILTTASGYVKAGGRLVYSTCTLLKEENENIVNAFLKEFKDFKLISAFNDDTVSTKTFLPPYDIGDGFFIAVMERA
jgi:16S rRNA (cytosine967-C5)-methyltransferase